MDAPVVTALQPSNFPKAGATVSIGGMNFEVGGSAQLSSHAATASWVSITTMRLDMGSLLPSASPQAVLTVSSSVPEKVQGMLQVELNYDLVPQVTALLPPNGPLAGGQLVTLLGQDFGSGELQFGLGSTLIPVSYTHLTLPTKRIV